MPGQVDLSRVSVTRMISREQHWIVRVFWVLVIVFYGGMCMVGVTWFPYMLGEFLRKNVDFHLTSLLLTAFSSFIWIGFFNTLMIFCHRHLFESQALPQLLTTPLTTRQLFRKSLKEFARVSAWTALPVGLAWAGFIFGFDGWHSPMMRSIPILVLLQILLNFTVPLFLCLFVRRFYQIVVMPIWTVLYFAAVLMLPLQFSLYKPGTIIWLRRLLEDRMVNVVVHAFPGAWIARYFLAPPGENRALWLFVILSSCLVAACLVLCYVRYGYTEEQILKRYDRRWTLQEKVRPVRRGHLSDGRLQIPFLNILYARWFSAAERAVISVALGDDFEGRLDRRAARVALLGLCMFLGVEILQLLASLQSWLRGSAEDLAPSILLCSSVVAIYLWLERMPLRGLNQ